MNGNHEWTRINTNIRAPDVVRSFSSFVFIGVYSWLNFFVCCCSLYEAQTRLR
jgi:hypothetical protein